MLVFVRMCVYRLLPLIDDSLPIFKKYLSARLHCDDSLPEEINNTGLLICVLDVLRY